MAYDFLGAPIHGTWCSCTDAPPARFHSPRCHAVPMPPAEYRVTIVGVKKAAWVVKGYEPAYTLALALRRAHPERWVDVRLDGKAIVILEPQALPDEDDPAQMHIDL